MKNALVLSVAFLCLFTPLLLGAGPRAAPAEELLSTPIGIGRVKPDWTTFDLALGMAPSIVPQADGVVYLNAESAAIVRWNGKQAALVNGVGAIKITDGKITRWDGDNERPLWRVKLPAGGKYRVIVNHSTTLAQQGAASISFLGAKKHTLNAVFPPCDACRAVQSLDAGEIELEAGETLVEFRPTLWNSPFEFSNLADVRLIPHGLSAAETRNYAKTTFPPAVSDPKARKTLFPTGGFDTLKNQPVDVNAPQVKLKIQPPPDAAARMARFKQRDTDASLALLCKELQSVLIAGTTGLERFESLCKAGKPREALAAYRDYFFAKLANPEAYGAVTDNIVFDLVRDRGKGELFLRPAPLVLEKNLHNAAVAQINGELVIGEIGPPGAAAWAPYGLNLPESARNFGRTMQDPFFKTPAGKEASRTLEFFRYLSILPSDRIEYFAGGLLPALLWSYAITGDKTHLARWCEYLDDWTMNATRDQDDQPASIRNAMDLETQLPRCMLNLLRIVLDERPEMAADFDAPTLARLMMKLVSDYAPYTIRARRAEMANWGIMGICHQQHIARFLHEFAAMDYFNREAWRLWNANAIQHRTLDGENMEAWDQGHNMVDIEYAIESVPFSKLPAGVDQLDLTSFWDDIRIDERDKVVHLSPVGNYWPFWENKQPRGQTSTRARWITNGSDRSFYDLIDNEPEVRSRLQTVMMEGHPADAGLPSRVSDIAPYAAMYYLRESWQPEADYLLMQNFRERSQTQDECSRTMFSLSKLDRILVEAHGLVVDGKPDNRYQDKPLTGGKTDYCGQVGRHTFDERFHTSARFDFAEALQDAPYAHHRKSYSDPYGLYKKAMEAGDPQPITDVMALRQVFGVRGEGIWIICDRIENRGSKPHEYTQFYSLPVRVDEARISDRLRTLATSGISLVEESEKAQRITTNNPGFENVSLYCFGPTPLKFANILNGKGEHEASKSTALEMVQAAVKSGQSLTKKPIRRPVSVRWSGAGNQVLVTAISSRPAATIREDVRDVEKQPGQDGVNGCRLITRSGVEVLFQSGPKPVNHLACGGVTAEAQSLLLLRKPGGQTSGIVLGCKSLTSAGVITNPTSADFEFELGAKSELINVIPIHRPIDTVRILPEQDAFTDRAMISFDIPTQKTEAIEFHYTLDGTDPTLNSPLYSTPFAIDKTTLVKVRPFRKGLTTTPWQYPGTDAGKTIEAVFRKKTPLPAVDVKSTEPGLKFSYFEGNWATLFSYAGIPGALEPKSVGTLAELLNARDLANIRATDRAYALRYDGLANIPATALYTFYAPPHLYTPTMDAGYDLRVFIDGQEWFPAPRLHAENTWSIPLQAGLHRFMVAFTDYRWKKFRNEYWMAWKEEEMCPDQPVLEISSPAMVRQTIPASWLRHAVMAR